MARTGLTRRLDVLEGNRRARDLSFDHITDDELEALTLAAIENCGTQGLTLAEDWRDQYRAGPIRFLGGVIDQIEEAIYATA